VFGGLGNQLFQYCAGRALSLQHGVEFRLLWGETSGESTTKRALDLHHFNIRAEIIKSTKFYKRLSLPLISTFLKHGAPVVLRESTLGYDYRFASLGRHTRLKGYWQSEQYFKKFECSIRKDLRIITPPSSQNQALLDRISSEAAVSLHVRRGDYVTNPLANSHHGTCDLTYYERAIRYISSHMQKEPVFYIFSDDPTWVKKNLNTGHKTIFVDFNHEATNYEDLRLMAQCKHNIIANSSFSWWGAWLNKNPSKIVVAPQKWYSDQTANNPDILPPAWWAC
tara:strand:+ start:93 stop:935 length:843 start_codon:yes stop_codon:yes gene_type:complete